VIRTASGRYPEGVRRVISAAWGRIRTRPLNTWNPARNLTPSSNTLVRLSWLQSICRMITRAPDADVRCAGGGFLEPGSGGPWPKGWHLQTAGSPVSWRCG